MIPIPMDGENIGPTFWIKKLNPFDPVLDLVGFQVLEGKEYDDSK